VCYCPGSEVDGSWVAVGQFRRCGASCGGYLCLMSDMSTLWLYWDGFHFLKDLGSVYVAAFEESSIVSVLCSFS
jgi:hypothetical protein